MTCRTAPAPCRVAMQPGQPAPCWEAPTLQPDGPCAAGARGHRGATARRLPG